MFDISQLTCVPIFLVLATGGVDDAVGAGTHDIGDTIPKAISDIRQTLLSTLIFDGIVQKGSNGHVLGAA
jgi:hypothetical protein